MSRWTSSVHPIRRPYVQNHVDRLLTAEQLEQITCAQRAGDYGEQSELVGDLLGHIRQMNEALRWRASRTEVSCDH